MDQNIKDKLFKYKKRPYIRNIFLYEKKYQNHEQTLQLISEHFQDPKLNPMALFCKIIGFKDYLRVATNYKKMKQLPIGALAFLQSYIENKTLKKQYKELEEKYNYLQNLNKEN